MGVLIAALTLLLLAVTVIVITGPLRAAAARRTAAERDPSSPASEPGPGGEASLFRRDELEAAREAKYREIRDAEMDFRTGKLSEADYRALDGELRAEALVILDGLDELGASSVPPGDE